jgi:hypothetical protein
MYKHNIEVVRVNIVAVKTINNITYSECLSLALAIEYEMRMGSILLSFVACLAVLYFSTLSHKRHDFRKKVLKNNEFLCKFCLKIFLNPKS